MRSNSSISLETRIVEISATPLAIFGATARKLASGVAEISTGKTVNSVTVEDFLLYLPTRYEDRSSFARIRDLSDGMEASLDLTVRLAKPRYIGRSRFIFTISASDAGNTGPQVLIDWFVSGARAKQIIEYYTKKFVRGTRFIAFGRWQRDKLGVYCLKVNKPDELEVVSAEDDSEDPSLSAIHVGRCVPVYRKINDVRPKQLREVMHRVLAALTDSAISETLPATSLQREKCVSRAVALRQIHFPPEDVSLADYENARSPAHRRLIFEELFWLTLGLAVKRGQRIKESKDRSVKIDDAIKKRIASVLPFKLTDAQRRVVKEIFGDLKSDAPRNRLLQGDVGSGKTIVALISMLTAMENGYQTALMAPTEILAEQHARNIKRILARSPYRIELLSGSIKSADKKRLHQAIAGGEVHAVIGTHALIQEAVKFGNLGLAVIDEQHRFGVMQRAELRSRGMNPDVLVMTATPIPRSLAMTVYGDLDVSIIDELPPGRTPIETMVFGEDQRLEVKKLITREVKAGRQVYVVYPLVEESEKIDLKDATRRYEYLRDVVFPKLRVGLLHGKMKPAEKEEVMRAFVAGDIKILVSTTVIEVGVDVPNASVMIVEHAERFVLSQLHQLRGRVGRGAKKSYCVLLTSDKKTAVAEERLGVMAKTNDGFVIAEKDLEIRGPGELLGTRQSGLPEFRIGNLVRDRVLLESAKREAEFYLNKEKSPVTAKLVARVKQDMRFELAAVG